MDMVLHMNKEQLSVHTERYKNSGLSSSFLENMAKVIAALKRNGYEPYDQLVGYVRTGNERYITRNDGARDIVMNMDVHDIKIFLKHYKDQR